MAGVGRPPRHERDKAVPQVVTHAYAVPPPPDKHLAINNVITIPKDTAFNPPITNVITKATET